MNFRYIGIIFIGIILFIVIGGFMSFVGNVSKQANTDIEVVPVPTVVPTPELTDESSPVPVFTPAPEVKDKKEVTATIKTDKGDIVLVLYPNEAPKTVENFIKKAKSGYYKNLTFHRVEDWVIQGGDPLGNGTGGGKMPTELNKKPFIVGSLGVARGQDIKVSNDSQFFITKTEAAWLDSQYTNFGLVKEGIAVVKKIEIGDKIIQVEID